MQIIQFKEQRSLKYLDHIPMEFIFENLCAYVCKMPSLGVVLMDGNKFALIQAGN